MEHSFEAMSVKAICEEIGHRLKAERLNQDLSQTQIYEATGLSRSTVYSAETTGKMTLETFVTLLKTLGIADQLEAVLPEPVISPIQLAKLDNQKRKRASGDSKLPDKGDSSW